MRANTLALTVLLIGGVIALMVLALLVRKCRRSHRFTNWSLNWQRRKCGCCKRASSASATIKQPKIQIVITSDSSDRFLRTAVPQSAEQTFETGTEHNAHQTEQLDFQASECPKRTLYEHEHEHEQQEVQTATEDEEQCAKCDSGLPASLAEERLRCASQTSRLGKLSDCANGARTKCRSPDYEPELQRSLHHNAEKVRLNEQGNEGRQEENDNRRCKRVRAFAQRTGQSHRTIDSGELDWKTYCDAERAAEPIQKQKRTSRSLVYRKPAFNAANQTRSNDTDSDIDDLQRVRVDASAEESLKLWSMRTRLELDEAEPSANCNSDSHTEYNTLSSLDSASVDDRRAAFSPICEESVAESTDGSQPLSSGLRVRPATTAASNLDRCRPGVSGDRRELFRALSKKRRQQRDSRAAACHSQNTETSFESGDTVDSTTDSIRPATTTSIESNTASTPDSVSQSNCTFLLDDKQEHDTSRWAVRHNSRRLRVRHLHALESVASCEREAGESDLEIIDDVQADDNDTEDNLTEQQTAEADDKLDDKQQLESDELAKPAISVPLHARPLTLQKSCTLPSQELQDYLPSRPRVDSACSRMCTTRISPSGRTYHVIVSPERSSCWQSTAAASRSPLMCEQLPLNYVHVHGDEQRSPNGAARRRMLPKLPPRRYDSEVNEEAIEARLVATVYKQPAAKCRSVNTAESERFSRCSRTSDLCPPPPPTPSPSLMQPYVLPRQHAATNQLTVTAVGTTRYALSADLATYKQQQHFAAAALAAPDSLRISPTANNSCSLHDSLLLHSAAALAQRASSLAYYQRTLTPSDSGSMFTQSAASNLTIQQMIPRKWSN